MLLLYFCSMKLLLTITLLLCSLCVTAQQYTSINDSVTIYNYRLNSGCDTSNLELKQIDQIPNSYDYLSNNDYCISITPPSSSISLSFTFYCPVSGIVYINSGYSVLSCSNVDFSSMVLMDNTTCSLVGQGEQFNVIAGHIYTWSLIASTTGVLCQGFSTICPYWLKMHPLIVDLIVFEGNMYNGYVDLKWSTASETNSHYFLLYKSDGFTDFGAIAKIPSSVNSSTIKSYSYIDKFPSEGANYYKLVEVDLNGVKHEYTTIYVYNPYGLNYEVFDELGRPSNLTTQGFKIIRYENGKINCRIVINH